MRFLLCFLVMGVSLQAMSLRLHNESASPLKAVIYGSDGLVLQEVDVEAKKTVNWNDNPLQKEMCSVSGPTSSKTPFVVHWVCPEGDVFCIVEDVSNGALVGSGLGIGKKVCNKPKE